MTQTNDCDMKWKAKKIQSYDCFQGRKILLCREEPGSQEVPLELNLEREGELGPEGAGGDTGRGTLGAGTNRSCGSAPGCKVQCPSSRACHSLEGRTDVRNGLEDMGAWRLPSLCI